MRQFLVIEELVLYLKRTSELLKRWFSMSPFFKSGYRFSKEGIKLGHGAESCFSLLIIYSLIFDSKAAAEQIIAVEIWDKYRSNSDCGGLSGLYWASISCALLAANSAAVKWNLVKGERISATILILRPGSLNLIAISMIFPFLVFKKTQWRYAVGLTDNVRVRRATYAHRTRPDGWFHL